MKLLRILYKYILHFLTAKNTHGFGVHSPFLFHFTESVIYNKSTYYIFSQIEKIRSTLKSDKRILDITDFGTGNNRSVKVAKIANKSLKSAKYAQLLYRLANYINAQSILELGTSLGLTTTYLAAPSSSSKCISLEGCPQIASIAVRNFNLLKIENIKVVVGDIDKTLSNVLNEFEQLDLVFMDANHKSQAVLNYFDQIVSKVHSNSVIVLDDIYFSSDMEIAWKIIKEHPMVMSTIDFFQIGIVFFNSDLNKKHYKMRY